MIKFKWIYITMGVLLLSLLGCEKLIFDPTNEETPGAEPKVHLSVNVRAAQPKSGLRSSINQETDFEDRVHNLAMLIFKSDNGERVGLHVIENTLGSGESTSAFQVEMTPGQYDLYFVGNMPNLQTALSETNIADRDAMNTYLANASRELSD